MRPVIARTRSAQPAPLTPPPAERLNTLPAARPTTPPIPPAPPQLRLTLLGRFHATAGPCLIAESAWRLRRPASLVKLLALAPELRGPQGTRRSAATEFPGENHRLHREQVMDLLWPDLEPATAANNLRVALFAARRTLSAAAPSAVDYLQRRGDWLVLCPDAPLWVDVDAFRAAAAEARRLGHPAAYRAATDLYAGELLPDDRYEDWAAGPREELRALFHDLLGELAHAHAGLGEIEPATEVLRRLVASDPLHEPAHRELMRLYAQTGQRERALAQYRQFRVLLHEQLDTEPDAASERLYQDLLARQFPTALSPPATTNGLSGSVNGHDAPIAPDAQTRQAHASLFLALAEQAEPELRGPNQPAWLDRLEREHDSLRVALAWLGGHEPERGLRLAAALAGFWAARGHLAEGRRWLDAMLAGSPEPTPVRCVALRGAGVLARMQGDFAGDRAYCDECLAVGRAVGDKEHIAAALFWRGTLAWSDGDHDQTRRLYEESLAVRRELGNRRSIANALLNLACLAYEVAGEYPRAHTLLDEAMAILRDIDDRPAIASGLAELSDLAHYEGDYARAKALAEELLAYHRTAESKRGIGWTLRRLGQIAFATGDAEEAERLLEESLALLRTVGDQWGAGLTLGALAHLMRAQGKHQAAAARLGEALPLVRTTGDRAAIARCLWYAGMLALEMSAHARGGRLLGAASHAHRRLRTSLRPEERADHDRAVAAAKMALGEDTYAAAYAEGEEMPLERAIEEARAISA